MIVMGLKGRTGYDIEEEGVNLPSDVLGVTTLKFRTDKARRSDAISPHCAEDLEAVERSDASVPEGRSRTPTSGLRHSQESARRSDEADQGLNTYAPTASLPSAATLVRLLECCVSTSSEALNRVERRFWTRPSVLGVLEPASVQGNRSECNDAAPEGDRGGSSPPLLARQEPGR